MAVVMCVAAPVRNDTIDDLVDLSREWMKLKMIRRRQPVIQNPFQGCLRSKWLNQLLQDATDMVYITGHVGTEQTAHDNFKRQPHHVTMNVACFALLPG